MQEQERQDLTEEERTLKVEQIIAWGEKVDAGEYTGHLDEYEDVGEGEKTDAPLGESEVGDMVILDLNDKGWDEVQRAALKGWMEEKLGTPLEQAPVRAAYLSPDGTTTVKVFDRMFGGKDDPWYLSEWQNEGEESSFILWSEEMFEAQEEFGYTKQE